MAASQRPPPFLLFAYGTLMQPEVMRAVCGVSFPAEKVVLTDYGRYRVKNEVFPAIIAEKDAHTHGLLYRDIDRRSLERLDAFEGDLYCRSKVRVTQTDGSQIRCLAYVFKDRYRHLLDDGPWDAELFRERHLADFLAGLAVNSRAVDN